MTVAELPVQVAGLDSINIDQVAKSIVRRILRKFKHLRDVEEILSIVTCALGEAYGEFDGHGDLQGWLKWKAFYKAVDEMRKVHLVYRKGQEHQDLYEPCSLNVLISRTNSNSNDEDVGETQSFQCLFAKQEHSSVLPVDYFKNCDVRDEMIIRMRYEDNAPWEVIAATTGISVSGALYLHRRFMDGVYDRIEEGRL